MARDSENKLTKHVAGETVLTEDFANSVYGGLFGSSEGDDLDPDDPCVAGHLHDGVHADGHAQKIDLVDHVTSQLRNGNLADDSVNKRNVQTFITQGQAIPEYEMISGDKHYFLDLSVIRSEISNNGAFSTTTNITSNSPGDLDLDDFVFGSDSLDDDGDSDHDSRMLFDKSKAAFRAGIVTSTEWDELNRGVQSVAFGRDNQVAATRATIAGGDGNTISGAATESIIGTGTGNGVSGSKSGILTGTSNTIGSSLNTFIGAGNTNDIGNSSANSAIVAGDGNDITDSSGNSFVGGGLDNTVDGAVRSVVAGGDSNVVGDGGGIGTSGGFIGSGDSNTIVGVNTAIVGGLNNEISGIFNSQSIIGGGDSNTITTSTKNCGIFAGKSNTVSSSAEESGILAGNGNTISVSDNSVIVGGLTNTISAVAGAGVSASFIGAGNLNQILDRAKQCIIVGGKSNVIDVDDSVSTVHNHFIGGGFSNQITGTGYEASYNFIGGGDDGHIIAIANDINHNSILNGTNNTINDAEQVSILGGESNLIVDSNASTIINGEQNTISGGSVDVAFGTIVNGFQNTVSKSNAVILTGSEMNNTTWGMVGFGFTNVFHGEALFVGRSTTVDSTHYLYLNNDFLNQTSADASTGERLELPDPCDFLIKATYVGRSDSGSDIHISGTIRRGGSFDSGTITFASASVNDTFSADSRPAGISWTGGFDIVSSGNSNGNRGLLIQVNTGNKSGAGTVRWGVHAEITWVT